MSFGVRTGSLPHCTPSSRRSRVNYLDVSKVLYVRRRAAGAKGGLRAVETFAWNMSFVTTDTTTEHQVAAGNVTRHKKKTNSSNIISVAVAIAAVVTSVAEAEETEEAEETIEAEEAEEAE